MITAQTVVLRTSKGMHSASRLRIEARMSEVKDKQFDAVRLRCCTEYICSYFSGEILPEDKTGRTRDVDFGLWTLPEGWGSRTRLLSAGYRIL